MSARQEVTPDDATEARVRRLVMVVRQACYFIADELGKEYGLERPCKRCTVEHRREARGVVTPRRV